MVFLRELAKKGSGFRVQGKGGRRKRWYPSQIPYSASHIADQNPKILSAQSLSLVCLFLTFGHCICFEFRISCFEFITIYSLFAFTSAVRTRLTGRSAPISSAIATTLPFKASISVFFPFRMSWSMEEKWSRVGGISSENRCAV